MQKRLCVDQIISDIDFLVVLNKLIIWKNKVSQQGQTGNCVFNSISNLIYCFWH
jgi:hypothetical protein